MRTLIFASFLLLCAVEAKKASYPGKLIPYWDESPNASYPVEVGTIDTNTILIWRITEGQHAVIACYPNYTIVEDTHSPYYFPFIPPVIVGDNPFVLVERRFTTPGHYYFRDTNRSMHGDVTVIRAAKDISSTDDDDESTYDRGLSVFNTALGWIVFFLLVISILGAAMVIVTFTAFSELRTFPIKLILYLCWTIVIGNIAFLFAFEGAFTDNEYLCYLVGMVVHGFFLANFCWTLCISFNFYQLIVRRNRESEKLELWYHLFAWGFPFGCIMWSSSFLAYGDAGGVCYITSPIFVFLFFFMPGLVVISINAILFFFVVREIHDTLSTAPSSDKAEKRKELRIYLSIFITVGLSWIFGFLMVLFSHAPIIRLIFLVLFSITTPAQGFLIFLFYCVNAKVFGKWIGVVRLCCRCLPGAQTFFDFYENLDISRSGTSSGRSTSSVSTLRQASSSFSSHSSMSTRSNLWDSSQDEYSVDEYLFEDPSDVDADGFPMGTVDSDDQYLESSSTEPQKILFGDDESVGFQFSSSSTSFDET